MPQHTEIIPLIALLTDFGTADPFVGILKGVIAQIAPRARVVDLTHEIPPGDVRRAAVVLWQAKPYFPPGTIFVCVVDPGVGTCRRGILAQHDGYTFISPDNGLLSFVLGEDFTAWELRNPAYLLPHPSATFHGRDVFAPAAAYAANGAPPSDFGPRLTDLVKLPAPRLEFVPPAELGGQVLHADRFGNLLTSLGCFRFKEKGIAQLQPWLPTAPGMTFDVAAARLQLAGGESLPWMSTFAQIPAGECGILIGSSGLLEICANRQSAAQLLGLHADEPITLMGLRSVS